MSRLADGPLGHSGRVATPDEAAPARQSTPVSGRRGIGARFRDSVVAFWRKGYEENLTGMAGMVAYSLLLSVFPFALVALFIAGRVLRSEELQASVLARSAADLPDGRRVDPLGGRAPPGADLADRGIVAVVGSIWFGSSFWGALDTAFCRIYHCECRAWVRQKVFAIGMFAVVLLFVAATVMVPTAQALLASGARDLPLGLSDVKGLVYGVTLAIGVVALFVTLCVIYRLVPNGGCRGAPSGPARSARRSRSASSTSASRSTWTTSRRCGSAPRRCSC